MAMTDTQEALVFDEVLPNYCFVTVVGAVRLDEKQRAVDSKGKVLPSSARRVYYLQQGRVFDEGHHLLEEGKLPAEVKAMVAATKANEASVFPGVTHEVRVLDCPVGGCPYRSCVESDLQAHLHTHEISQQERERLQAEARGTSRRFSASDFMREDLEPQGVTGDTGAPGEE